MASREWENPDAMMSVDEVFDRIISSISSRPPTRVDLLASRGLVLAEDVTTPSDVPPFSNSAMDGFAIRSGETIPGQPVTFRLIGTVAAGDAEVLTVGPGEAARIMTGAPMPGQADAVIRFEEVEENPQGTVLVRRSVAPGENVRLAGEDVAKGEVILRKGTVIRSPEIGLLAATGITAVAVHGQPRIAIISTGDEVVEPGVDLKSGQIRDANSYLLASMVSDLGAQPVRIGIAADTRSDLSSHFQAAAGCDFIVTSGGVSHGDFDLVKDVMRQKGRVDIWTVRMKPGKPLAYGTIGDTPLLGLPGNPAAAAVAFHQFGRPAILKMLGHRKIRLPIVRARLEESIENRGRRRHFERGIVRYSGDGWVVRPTGIHGSAMLSGLSSANCYIVVSESIDNAPAGSEVDVQLLGPEVFATMSIPTD
ncbi:MAG: molybdopterin molybdotransferase MoeA [Thermomicrobiales bacterium]